MDIEEIKFNYENNESLYKTKEDEIPYIDNISFIKYKMKKLKRYNIILIFTILSVLSLFFIFYLTDKFFLKLLHISNIPESQEKSDLLRLISSIIQLFVCVINTFTFYISYKIMTLDNDTIIQQTPSENNIFLDTKTLKNILNEIEKLKKEEALLLQKK